MNINPFSADTIGRSLILAIVGWAMVWRWVSKSSPEVAGAVKRGLASKAISIVGRILR